MTAKQKATIKFNIKKKLEKGEITQQKHDEMVAQLQTLAANGATLQEANQQLGMYKTGAKASAAPKKPAMTYLEYSTLKLSLGQLLGEDEITDIQYLKAKEILDKNKGKSKEEAKIAVAQYVNSATGSELMSVPAGVDPFGKPQTPKGMTQAEYFQMSDALAKKKDAGLITPEEQAAQMAKLHDAYVAHKTASEIEKEIGVDPGTLAADQAILDLGQKFKGVYGQAVSEMQAQLDEFLKKYKPEMDALAQKVQDGTITPEEYNWLKTKTLQQEWYQNKLTQMGGTMLHANQQAMALINGEMLGVFAENANWQSFQITQDAKMDLSFSVYDENTVQRLIKDEPELLPRREVKGQKDIAWNRDKIAAAVTQAVIQGDSIPKLAKRIAAQTGESNMKAMTRYARTAMTSAQNSGRMEMLKRAKGMGIQVKKRWLATLDSRTRDSHRKMDGVTAEVDEDFVTPLGSKMKCPGDFANAKGGDIWNCRCTLVYEYEGFPDDPENNERIQYDEYWTTETDENGKEHKVFHRTSSLITDMNYEEWKAAKQGTKLNELNDAKIRLGKIQKEFLKAKVKEDKIYEGLWKDPVTLADYPAKKAGIQAKRDYYTAEIEKYNQAMASGASWATQDKIDELVKKRKLLDEFEKRGQLLQDRNAALKEIQDLYDEVGYQGTAQAPDLVWATKKGKKKEKDADSGASGMDLGATGGQKTQFAPDAWDAKTRQAAPLYRDRRSADKDLRKELDDLWGQLPENEQYATWEYTRNSNPMNKSLSGYHDDWQRRSYLGPENTDWGHEDSWRPVPGEFRKFGKNGHADYKQAITDLTMAIERTRFTKDRWLTRGSEEGGLAGLMEGAGMDFKTVKSILDSGDIGKIRQALVGKQARNHAFTSTGIATDAGFSGSVKYRIYAPKGTKGIYAEPQSYYGATVGTDAKLYKTGQRYSSVGSEAEVILQRGTTFVIRDVKYSGRNLEVEMDIVEQPDYFVHGDEDTFNGGKTRHKR